MHVLQRRAAGFSCALGIAGHANAQVLISQVYGGGGNSGATLGSDFIELHNIGSTTVSLDGWSVQYASAAGSSWQVTPLTGSVPAGGYYLIKQADGGGGSVALPTPDATGTLAMSGTAGKPALSSSASALSGTCPTGNADLVGYGSTASCAEGNAPTPAPSNTLAALRGNDGCTDTDNNAADFATAAPAPRNAASAARLCNGGGQPNADFPGTARNDANTPTRLSDHDPTAVLLRMRKHVNADLGMAVAAARAQVTEGERIDFSVDVENRGPDSAAFAAVAFAFDAAVSPRVTAAPGWICQPPQTGTQMVVTCTIASLAAGNAQNFSVQVEAGAALAGRTLTLAASAASQTPDPQSSNDTDAASVTVQARPQARGDLAVRFDGPTSLPTTAFNATYRVLVSNVGAAPAQRPSLVIAGNTVSALSQLVPPQGWQCDKQAQALRSARFVCSTTTVLLPGAQAAFQLTVAAKPIPAEGAVRVQATATSSSQEANPADDTVLIVTLIGGSDRRR
ncbi:hypothetical protein EYC54_02560 [Xanthomonas oryzae]|uniref:lamin tail domain-containing protein n=1 Tax=Xanthomonas oryzae TaxID=347 RepID=UPI001034D9F9|nr:lamin tail domain-containing protein [Xanthomonas oryzae]QBG86843.1 hypothetical protein EYC54_02560 [Xanthomonas oryzae]